MTDTDLLGGTPAPWAGKSAREILADIDRALLTIDGQPFPVKSATLTVCNPIRLWQRPQLVQGLHEATGTLLVSAKAMRAFHRALARIERRSMSRRAWRRLRGRRKAARRAL